MADFIVNAQRTPIAGMIGMAELLLEDKRLTEEHRDCASKILRSGEILLEMVGLVLVSDSV